jgi:hypothetical protein
MRLVTLEKALTALAELGDNLALVGDIVLGSVSDIV